MGLFDSIRSLFSAPRPAVADTAREERLDAIIEESIASVVPKVRAVTGYKAKLRAAVRTSLVYARELMEELGEPVLLSRGTVKQDPLVSALFLDADQLGRLLDDKAVRECLAVGDECCFLLTAVRQEAAFLGNKTSMTFVDHRIIAPSPSLKETRGKLAAHYVKVLAEDAARSILQAKTSIAELEETRDTIKAQMSLLKLSSRPEATAEEQARIERELGQAGPILADVERELARVRSRFDSLDDYLREVISILEKPADHLRVEHFSFCLDEFNILHQSCDSATPSHLISFVELVAPETRRTAVLARARRQDEQAAR